MKRTKNSAPGYESAFANALVRCQQRESFDQIFLRTDSFRTDKVLTGFEARRDRECGIATVEEQPVGRPLTGGGGQTVLPDLWIVSTRRSG